jgi:F0F1-type ATP synthase membrane subunit b/b'
MLSIDATVLVTFAVVWILVLILSRVFFKPMNRILGERTAGLERARIETETTLAGCEEDLRRIEERLGKAQAASEALWEQTEAQAIKEKSRLIQDLQAETRAQVQAATRELEREVERLKKELDARSGELSEDIAQRILN